MFYDNFKAACARKGTTITAVLAEIGRASGDAGGWKMGKYPRLDIVTEIADYLNISLDELVYGLRELRASLLRIMSLTVNGMKSFPKSPKTVSSSAKIFCVLIWFLHQKSMQMIREHNIP